MNVQRTFGHSWVWLAAACAVLASPVAAPSAAQAQPGIAAARAAGRAASGVETDSAIFIERQVPGKVRRLEPASTLSRGDKVVTILTWQRARSDAERGGGFTITNPMPRVIAYQKSTRAGEEVSADGGRTWGQLGMLRIGSRLASPEDVTHVRWRISPGSAAQGRGQIAYSGIVR